MPLGRSKLTAGGRHRDRLTIGATTTRARRSTSGVQPVALAPRPGRIVDRGAGLHRPAAGAIGTACWARTRASSGRRSGSPTRSSSRSWTKDTPGGRARSGQLWDVTLYDLTGYSYGTTRSWSHQPRSQASSGFVNRVNVVYGGSSIGLRATGSRARCWRMPRRISCFGPRGAMTTSSSSAARWKGRLSSSSNSRCAAAGL